MRTLKFDGMWLLRALVTVLAVSVCSAKDDGSQMAAPFRLNYLGYFTDGPKTALFVGSRKGVLAWGLLDAAGSSVTAGESRDFIERDFALGDSFYRIDFSRFSVPGKHSRLTADGRTSEPFYIDSVNPYGRLFAEAFDYFHDQWSCRIREFLPDGARYQAVSEPTDQGMASYQVIPEVSLTSGFDLIGKLDSSRIRVGHAAQFVGGNDESEMLFVFAVPGGLRRDVVNGIRTGDADAVAESQ